MKLLTLNTHSWLEQQQEHKINTIVDFILKEQFDVIALQEVNQISDNPHRMHPTNFVYVLKQRLLQSNLHYHIKWHYSHDAYQRYQEGVAIMSLHEIEEVDAGVIHPSEDTNDIFQRAYLGIKCKTYPIWFYSIHFSWWHAYETFHFEKEWNTFVIDAKIKNKYAILLGDFNNPSDIRKEGYDLITQTFYDSYKLAKQTHGYDTIQDAIAGWEQTTSGKRIDYILCNWQADITAYTTVFDNIYGSIVSDHYGIMVELKDDALPV